MARSSSLRQRVVTAFVLGPLVIAAVLLLPAQGFAAFLGLVALGAAWEWGALAGLEGRPARAAFVALAALGLLLLWIFPDWRPWLVAAG
ncbi:MAG: phosphatidate cytidylyltransferase, partial [Chromatiaceae bacterium]